MKFLTIFILINALCYTSAYSEQNLSPQSLTNFDIQSEGVRSIDQLQVPVTQIAQVGAFIGGVFITLELSVPIIASLIAGVGVGTVVLVFIGHDQRVYIIDKAFSLSPDIENFVVQSSLNLDTLSFISSSLIQLSAAKITPKIQNIFSSPRLSSVEEIMTNMKERSSVLAQNAQSLIDSLSQLSPRFNDFAYTEGLHTGTPTYMQKSAFNLNMKDLGYDVSKYTIDQLNLKTVLDIEFIAEKNNFITSPINLNQNPALYVLKQRSLSNFDTLSLQLPKKPNTCNGNALIGNALFCMGHVNAMKTCPTNMPTDILTEAPNESKGINTCNAVFDTAMMANACYLAAKEAKTCNDTGASFSTSVSLFGGMVGEFQLLGTMCRASLKYATQKLSACKIASPFTSSKFVQKSFANVFGFMWPIFELSDY